MAGVSVATKPMRSDFCGLGNPSESHARCSGDVLGHRCPCDCHQTPATPNEPHTAPTGGVNAENPCGGETAKDGDDSSSFPSGAVPASPVVGVVRDMPPSEYHSHPALSQSKAKVLLDAPSLAHALHQLENPEPPTVQMEEGTVVHYLMFGGEAPVLVDAPNWQTKIAKEARAEARAKGLVPLLEKDLPRLEKCADAVRNHPTASALLDEGDPELSMFGYDPETGVPMRGRADFLNAERHLVDLKTTQDASLDAFGVSIAKYGYDIQCPWYMHLAQQNDLIDDDSRYVFVVVERDEPFDITIQTLHPDDIKVGRAYMRHALDLYAKATFASEWPSYPTEVMFARVPAWRGKGVPA